LLQGKVNISDVGSTGGLDQRWTSLESVINIYSFDPDSRAEIGAGYKKVFPIGLWSSEKTLELFLTRFQPASSLFRPNEIILKEYLN
jgi:hypothetical protein